MCISLVYNVQLYYDARCKKKFYTKYFNTKKIPCTFAIAVSNTKNI